MAIDFEDRVKARRQAVDAALGQVNTSQWTLLTAAGFIILAALSTTHQDLLVGKTFQLPVIAANASLVPFYVLAPVLLVLLQVALVGSYFGLRRTLQRHEEEVALTAVEAQGFHRSDLPEAAELDIAGRRRADHHSVRKRTERVLKRLALLWLVPSVLLLLQWRFAPYQHRAVTALHLVLFAATVWGTFIALPHLRRQTPSGLRTMLRRSLRHRRYGLAVRGVATLASLYLLIAASFGLPLARMQLGGMPMRIATATGTTVLVNDLDDAAMALREEALTAREITPAYYNAASMSRFDGMQGLDLRGRRLRHADLSFLGLARVDLSDADLVGAVFDQADLRGANLRDADLSYARLDNAQLDLANLTGVTARNAVARWASFSGAMMFSADFSHSDLAGSNFYFLRVDDPGPWPGGYKRSGFCQPKFDHANLERTSFLGTDEKVSPTDPDCPDDHTITVTESCRAERLVMLPRPDPGAMARVGAVEPSRLSDAEFADQIARATVVAARVLDHATLPLLRHELRRIRAHEFALDRPDTDCGAAIGSAATAPRPPPPAERSALVVEWPTR